MFTLSSLTIWLFAISLFCLLFVWVAKRRADKKDEAKD